MTQTIVLVVCGATGFVLLVIAGLILRHRHTRLMVALSPSLNLVLVALLLCELAGAVLSTCPPKSDVMCHAQMGFTVVPIVGILAVFTGKVDRVNKLFSLNSILSVPITNAHILLRSGAVILAQLVLMAVFIALPLVKQVLVKGTGATSSFMVLKCQPSEAYEMGHIIWVIFCDHCVPRTARPQAALHIFLRCLLSAHCFRMAAYTHDRPLCQVTLELVVVVALVAYALYVPLTTHRTALSILHTSLDARYVAWRSRNLPILYNETNKITHGIGFLLCGSAFVLPGALAVENGAEDVNIALQASGQILAVVGLTISIFHFMISCVIKGNLDIDPTRGTGLGMRKSERSESSSDGADDGRSNITKLSSSATSGTDRHSTITNAVTVKGRVRDPKVAQPIQRTQRSHNTPTIPTIPERPQRTQYFKRSGISGPGGACGEEMPSHFTQLLLRNSGCGEDSQVRNPFGDIAGVKAGIGG
jgi:hypothetical protein